MYLLLGISLTFWLGVYKGTSGSHSTSRHLPSIMSTSIEFTTGKRGKENVIADGCRYSLDKRRTTATARHAANKHPSNPTSLETLAIPPSVRSW